MVRALPALGAGAVAVAVAETAGSGSARDVLAAIEITTAVCVVLAVAGLLALLVYRVRRERLTYRPDPGIARTRVRAEITATYPASGPERRQAARAEIGRPIRRPAGSAPLALPPADGTRHCPTGPEQE